MNEDIVNVDKIINPNIEEDNILKNLLNSYMTYEKKYIFEKKCLENQK
jgi:hypothetical protein